MQYIVIFIRSGLFIECDNEENARITRTTTLKNGEIEQIDGTDFVTDTERNQFVTNIETGMNIFELDRFTKILLNYKLRE
jgi:predicted membrane protein